MWRAHHDRNYAFALAAGLAVAAARLRRETVRVSPGAALRASEALLRQWFAPGRRVLAVVSARGGAGRTRTVARLGHTLAELGRRTLLVDGDFRAPTLHRALGLANRQGLADLLAGRPARLATVRDGLSVLVAGEAHAEPLELLSCARLPVLLAEASRHFDAVLVDTPAAARGPDYEMFAALAGGVLALGKPAGAGLQAGLARARARIVLSLEPS